jgi:hypothetical protein
MSGIQARIAFFQNQSNGPGPLLPNRPLNHPNFHAAAPTPPSEPTHPHIIKPKPSATGSNTPALSKVKLAPLNPVSAIPVAESPSPPESPRVQTHLPPLTTTSDTDKQPKSNFRDKVAMLGAIKGGGMAQHDYRSKPRPGEPGAEAAAAPETRTALPVLVRPSKPAKRSGVME